ncbi:hypothetical protein [Paenibacillus sinopodophylli]|uniref:hypothetical protein n=1 Tax=Paenibacillus sinopodophylli TaxID=1837342 RepID=UPI00110CB5F4|nr:hypothetical protein [Paenibacillus sinopodophylli]
MSNAVGQAHSIDVSAATQFQGPGAIIVDDFQKEITDALRRNSVLDARLNYVPATGDISTYYEQNTINGGASVDPRNPSSNPTSNPRNSRGVKVKATTNQVNFGHYDLIMGQQQANFPELKAKDLNDMLNGIGLHHGRMLWRGTDTNLATPTTLQYVGLSKQITNTFIVSLAASIVSAICAKVAAMVSSETYELMPTAVYIHPLAHHYLVEEEKLAAFNSTHISNLTKTTIAGLTVPAVQTAAGVLPLIPEPFMPSVVNATRPENTDYGVAIVTEPMIEYHYVGEKGMYLFQLGTTGNLQEQYVGIKYGAPVAKGPSYAHAYGTIERPTIAPIG